MGLALAVIVLPLVPVMNFVPIYRAAADRYLYLPLAGVGLAVGFLVDAPWLTGWERLRDRMLIALAMILPVLGMACIARQSVWSSPVALWEDTFAKNPTAFTAASGLGKALLAVGSLPEAERFTREALRLTNGTRGETWAMLAVVLDGQGRGAEAEAAVSKALELDSRLGDPEARVAALAMERGFATAFGRLLAKRPRP
jgi:tetratricopeptide (TPR) repeat protein